MDVKQKKIALGVVLGLCAAFLLVGALGMLICFFLIWSENALNVMGAGMGFITGAILMGTALIALAVTVGRQTPAS